MEKLQEAYDSTTKLTMAVQQLGQQLVKAGCSSLTRDSIRQGLQLCSNLVPSAMKMSELLTSSPTEGEANQVMKEARPIYSDSEAYYLELVSMAKAHAQKTKIVEG